MKPLYLTILAIVLSFSAFAIGPIVGPTNVCANASITLSNATPGGTWTSSNTFVATVSNLGVVTATPVTSIATTVISYDDGSSVVTATITALPLPGGILGISGVCVASSIQLSNMTPGGTWSCSNSTIATISPGPGGGTLYGINAGTVNVTYTALTGCSRIAARDVVATLPPITSPTTLCGGIAAGMSLVNAITGGTWTSSNHLVATVSGTNLYTASVTTTSTTTITYTVGSGCSTNTVVTVNPTPQFTYSVVAGGGHCFGGPPIPYDISGSDPALDYQFYISSTPVGPPVHGTGGPMNFGSYTAIGYYIVMAYYPGTGCSQSHIPIIIEPLPADLPVTGGGTSCPGSPGVSVNIGLGASQTGVSYQLYGPGMIPVGTPIVGAGGAIPFAPVTAAGTYSVMATNNTTGCYKWMSGTATVTTGPTISTITGSSTICAGSTETFSTSTPGGTWSSNNFSVATVGSLTGLVTSVAPGVAVISYSMGGCTETKTVTVNAQPNTYNISGGGTYCTGGPGVTISLSGSEPGISYFAVMGVSPVSVMVAGTGGPLSLGPITIGGSPIVVVATNTVTSCSSVMSGTVTVTAVPAAAISGPASVCNGSLAQLSANTSGGTWTSSNYGIAAVGIATGLVSATGTGAAVIQYNNGSCIASHTITVLPTPSISGPTSVCDGMVAALSSSSIGGSWSCSNTNIASASSAGLVNGLSPGVVNISYTLGSGCNGVKSFTVHPFAPITGATTVCAGNTTTVSNTVAGGAWTSSDPSVASINPFSPVVYGVSGGTAVIFYSLPTGCTSSMSLTVVPTPVISGPSTVCDGGPAVAILSATIPGGVWISSNPTIATIDVTGIVTGFSTGATNISYISPSGCTALHSFTVLPLVVPISGPALLCSGSSITVSTTTIGGAWSSTTPAVATVSGTGDVFGITTGVTVVSYTMPTGCYRTTTITVSAPPTVSVSVSPSATFCAGNTAAFTTSITAGTSPVYQWYLNGIVISGATSSSFTSPALVAGDSISVQAGMIATCDGSTVAQHAYTPITVHALPTVTASAAASGCGSTYNLNASGTGISYLWSPTTGLSCSTCAAPVATIGTSASYTVTTTDANGCAASDHVALNGNRISGYINYTGVATDSFRVWLINYDPIDSTVTALDSTVSCMDGGIPYYEFTNPAAGSYVVKAMLFGTVPGTSGYIPTYGLSSANWFGSTSITHTTNTDNQAINMIYGTVPAGPGFIAGNVYSGAGKGTTGEAPVEGMVVYLRNTATQVLTYTYTTATGSYFFGDLAYGSYVIYPEEFDYYTTPSAVITLSAASPSVTGINFKQHTDNGTITPMGATFVQGMQRQNAISAYPNPAQNEITLQWTGLTTGAADIIITDLVGRSVLERTLEIKAATGNKIIDISGLGSGFYLLSFRSGNEHFVQKITIEK